MLTPAWKRLFQLEVAICVATAAYGAFAPAAYQRALFADPPAGAHADYLVVQAAGILFCAWGYLYARLLHARPFHEESFRRLQEAMAIGDVIVLAASVAALRNPGLALRPAAIWAQVGMAALWLGLRVAYLARRRPASP